MLIQSVIWANNLIVEGDKLKPAPDETSVNWEAVYRALFEAKNYLWRNKHYVEWSRFIGSPLYRWVKDRANA